MKRKSFTNYKKAGKKQSKPAGVVAYRPKDAGYKMRIPRRMVSMQSETKYFDTAGTNAVAATADWTGSEIPCDNYIQSDGVTVGAYTESALGPSANGPGYGQVLGGKYRILKIRVRGLISIDASSAGDPPGASIMSRVVLVMDLQAGGSQLQGEQVFSDMGTVTNCVNSFQQQGQAIDKYRILKDQINVHDIAGIGSEFDASTFVVGWKAVPFSFTYTPAKPLIVNVLTSGSVPLVAQIKDINIFLLARSGATGNISFVSRCYYTDS